MVKREHHVDQMQFYLLFHIYRATV